MKAAEPKYNFESERSDYLTPPEIWRTILNFLNLAEFTSDVCCSVKNVSARIYYTLNGIYSQFRIMFEKENGLTGSWVGICWLNPPFDITDKFVKKAVSEVEINNCEVWGIIPCRTETKYFKKYIMQNPNAFYAPLQKCIRFLNPDNKKPMGVYKNSLCIVYFGKRAAELVYKWNWEAPFDSVAFQGVEVKKIIENKQLSLLEV